MTEDKKAWLELRRKHITGTDIAAIVGKNDYSSAYKIYLEKKGLIEDTFQGNDKTWAGTELEEPIARLYQNATGNELIKPEFISKGIFGGTPDRLCTTNKNLGLEIKVAGNNQLKHYGDTGTDQVPTHYLFQCAWYMMLTDRSQWDLAVMFDPFSFGPNKDNFRIYTIHRNIKLEEALINYANNFWEEYIIRDVTPPIDASDAAKKYLDEKFPSNNGKLITAPEEAIEIAKKYVEIKNQLKTLETDKEFLENHLKQLVGENDGIVNDFFTFTWKKTKDGEKIDYEGLLQELKVNNDLIKKYTSVKEGYRKTYIKHTFNANA